MLGDDQTQEDALPHPEAPPLTLGAAEPMSVAILCGGESRRMGTDKAIVPLLPGGPPLLAIVIDRVRPVGDELFLVGVPGRGYDQFRLPLVADDYPGLGPLGGIATALRHASHPACLVVACDMPFLNQGLLMYMAGKARATFDVLVPVTPRGGAEPAGSLLPQPLHAIYRRSCLPVINDRIAAGERRATGFYDQVRVQIVTPPEIEALDPDLRSFVSINTPEALWRARAWLEDSPSAR